jgi:hypothetical protein
MGKDGHIYYRKPSFAERMGQMLTEDVDKGVLRKTFFGSPLKSMATATIGTAAVNPVMNLVRKLTQSDTEL